MAERACRDCAFVEVVIAEKPGVMAGHYRCHRFPPTWPEGSAFPGVGGDWWCGEFAAVSGREQP